MNKLIKNMTVEDIIRKEFYKKSRTQESIAHGLGISQSTVSRIVGDNIVWAINNHLVNLTAPH